jgi:hypothetical protein
LSKEIDESVLLNALASLGESRQKMVVVGGWCPYLYAKYLWKIPMQYLPRTTDIDIGVHETGSIRFSPTVYERMVKAGYIAERIYEDEPLPIEFIHKDGRIEVKVEFITSFEVSDDTLQRFLGSEMACHRIEGFDILLRTRPISLEVPYRKQTVKFNLLSPEIYFFHKGITFTGRASEEKRNKDMQYLYFMLKSCPKKQDFLNEVFKLKDHEYFHVFKDNILTYLGDVSCPGYPALAGMIGIGFGPGYKEIEAVFRPLVEILKDQKPR